MRSEMVVSVRADGNSLTSVACSSEKKSLPPGRPVMPPPRTCANPLVAEQGEVAPIPMHIAVDGLYYELDVRGIGVTTEGVPYYAYGERRTQMWSACYW
jgi:hypothetical protein